MGLIGWIRHYAAPRPLLVTARDGRAVRMAVQRSMRERGWEPAVSPAEADLLTVCGTPDVALEEAVARVWAQLPSPRARADIRSANRVADELDRARARLTDLAWQRADWAERSSTTTITTVMHGESGHDQRTGPGAGSSPHVGSADDAQHSPARDDNPRTDAGAPATAPGTGRYPGSPAGSDMGGGHDMHMTHGGEVAGLPMADRAPDRDGLTLDVLHVTLGPVLAEWPAGLVVRMTLQGDVVQTAEVELVGEPGAQWDGPPAAAALDSLACLLSVCGWSTAARTARRLRDDVLAGTVDDVELKRFAARLRRSRTLRWATDGVGPLDDPDLGGDATDRWRRWVDVALGGAPGAGGSADRVLEVLPGLLEGRELGAARVLVASFDPDLDALGAAP